MCPLNSEEKKTLLVIARKSIEAALSGGPPHEISALSGNLAELRGAFVTLHCRGRLRGCIGRIATLDSLAAVVAECATGAAIGDPRFSQLAPMELPDLEIEISVLSELRRAAADEVQPGIHGLLVSKGTKRGILLPQVAEKYKWPREYFLEQTCCKAGLDPGDWKDQETRIEVFTAQIFSEAEFPAVQAAAEKRAPAVSSDGRTGAE